MNYRNVITGKEWLCFFSQTATAWRDASMLVLRDFASAMELLILARANSSRAG